MSNKPKILLIDDSPTNTRIGALALRKDFDVVTLEGYYGLTDLYEHGRCEGFSAVVTDYNLGGDKTGVDIAAFIKSVYPTMPVLLFSHEYKSLTGADLGLFDVVLDGKLSNNAFSQMKDALHKVIGQDLPVQHHASPAHPAPNVPGPLTTPNGPAPKP